MKKKVKYYRAFACAGFVHGGGTFTNGPWHRTYAKALADCEPVGSPIRAYDDSAIGIQVCEMYEGTQE